MSNTPFGNYGYARQRQLLREKQEARGNTVSSATLDTILNELPTFFNARYGLVTGWLVVYNKPRTGKPNICNLKLIERGSFSKTIADLYQVRARTNNAYLCQYRWEHREYIGGITDIYEDALGIVYVGELDLHIPQARKAFTLCEQKAVGSSFGFDTISSRKQGGFQHIQTLALIEISLTKRPADRYARVIKTEVGEYEPVFSRR